MTAAGPVLLSGRALHEAVERVLAGSRALCAVAFWGLNSESLFKTRNRQDVRVICNLTMGGTNPRVIERMCATGIAVRQCDTLHAKLYIGEFEAVLTSANASVNGLGFSDNAGPGWIEAGTIIPASEAMDWFENLWTISREIEIPGDIETAWILFSRTKLIQTGRMVAISEDVVAPPLPLDGEAIAEVRQFYYGLSVRRAIISILTTHATPLGAQQIAAELEAGGLSTSAGVYRSVNDALQEGYVAGKFVRVAKGVWALSNWPNNEVYQVQRRAGVGPRAPLTDEQRAARRELSIAGLKAAKERGVVGGKPRKIFDKDVADIVQRHGVGESKQDLAIRYKVHPHTIHRILRKHKII